MIIKNLIDEDFVNYKKPSMFIGCHTCTFKCDKMANKQVCQNGTLANSPDISIPTQNIVQRYLDNPYSESIVFGGLEPFDDIEEVLSFIELLRNNGNNDDVVIYTGYTENEVTTKFATYYKRLKEYRNIVIKFGRFIPDCESHIDNVLGIELHSDNQYAKRIS